jgi:hypothetical protein
MKPLCVSVYIMGHLILGALGNILRPTGLLFGIKLPNKCECFSNKKMTFSFRKLTAVIIKKMSSYSYDVFSNSTPYPLFRKMSLRRIGILTNLGPI